MLSSDQGSLGKGPKSIDKRHGRFRAPSPTLGPRNERPSKCSLPHAEGALRIARAQGGDDGLAGEGGLPLGPQRPPAVGQIDVDARAEADHADALADADGG